MSERVHDVVLFGATGFTGRLVARYLASRSGPNVRWALGGRNREALERLRQEVGGAPGVLVADAGDAASLDAVARSARVVLTTVGPYERYGEPLVAACARAGTDYADLTGEPAFVDRMIDRHDAAARETGARIVNCCGFESIPADLGTLLAIRRLEAAAGGSLAGARVEVESTLRARGGFSGGTWQSAIGILADLRAAKRRRRERGEPPAGVGRQVGLGRSRVRYRRDLGAWAMPFPVIDRDVVLRTARAMPSYGASFEYAHSVAVPRIFGVAGAGIAAAGLFALAQFGPTRRLLQAAKRPGEGPDEATRARSWFELTVEARSGTASVRVRLRGGDAGYEETSKIFAEAGLCLALDRDRLSPVTGLVTPAMAMGEPLVERLAGAGLRFEPL